MTPPDNEWSIRGPLGNDLPFLYSTWLNSYRCDSEIGRSTRKSVFFREYNCVLDAILSDPETRVFIACLPDDPNVIVGFLVSAPKILHYCFVKEDFRRFGVARSLYHEAFDGAGAEYFTHRTEAARPIFQANPSLIYNPFLLFSRKKPQELGENSVENCE